MSGPHTFRRFAQITQKWCDLVDRRCAHFIELHTSGRWKRYYTEQQFLLLMREAVRFAEIWAEMVPRPGEENAAKPAQTESANPSRRTAA
jgi:uncharacterized repeat protein (TIGR03809 family)